MKNRIFNKLFLPLTFLSMLGLVSCHDDIYGSINNEVELESSGLQGDMSSNSITRFGDYIFVCNGYIYYKSTSAPEGNHNWHKTTSPSYGSSDYDVPDTTYFIAASSDYLYALTYTWDEDDDGSNSPTTAILYATSDTNPADGLTWTKVENISGGNYDYGNVRVIFDNKAYDEDNRVAYASIRSSSNSSHSIYELNGTSAPEKVSSPTFIDSETNEENAISACYLKTTGTDYFSRGYSMTASYDGNYIYWTKTHTDSNNVDRESDLYYFDGTTATSVDVDEGGILSVAATKDYILLGTTSGLARARLNGDYGVPTGSTHKFSNNGDSIITEYVFMVFVLDPSKNEGKTHEYAASTIYGSISSSSDSWDDTGLYAYYPGRDEWNRDGD